MSLVYLSGSEDVRNAGHDMRNAASDMLRAANMIDQCYYAHQQFMSQWLIDFQNIAKELNKDVSQR